MDTIQHFVRLTKADKDPVTGFLHVEGKMTGAELDLDEQRCDPTWLKAAVPAWFATGANIREMHSPNAVGKGVHLAQDGDDWLLRSIVVDPVAVTKVENEVLTGYSIGIRSPRVIHADDAPGGRIVGGSIIETSLVDRPAYPTAKFVVAKRAGSGLVPAAEWVELDGVEKAAPPPQGSTARDKLAAGDFVFGDERTFPVLKASDVMRAVNSWGRYKGKHSFAQFKSKLTALAKRKGFDSSLPDAWTSDSSSSKAAGDAADLAGSVEDEPGEDAEPDLIGQAYEALSALLVGEAEELADGEGGTGPIAVLLDMLNDLTWFQCCDDMDDARAAATAMKAVTTEEEPVPVTTADLIKSINAATDEERVALELELRKMLVPAPTEEDPPATKAAADTVLTKADLESALDTRLAKVVAPEELDELKERLTKVEGMAAPSGPVRALADAAQAAERTKVDKIAAADALDAKAVTINDHALAEGYRAQARALRAEAA